ncbi:hypothetical protein MKQ70_32480 [Chitinophaga sedimenti]|uniref:hypothetical protein n=1 Tax=Chitinophaga sedimenti TaxID=2033606 RepID=UPI0020068AB6|nr:hypothetical protein [Chitinophaga sedimenti]MCK7559434.1 hypothetical protein [Chitinophaga sedimenti]
MKKFVVPALVALVAACKGQQKLAGTYVYQLNGDIIKFQDTLTIKRNPDGKRGEYKVDRKYDVWTKKFGDTTIYRHHNGNYNQKDSTLALDNNKTPIQHQPRQRKVIYNENTYRKIKR